jgi:hypothetical protein
MDRIGISFRSFSSPEEIRSRYIRPLRTAVEAARGGVYSNYLRQEDVDPSQPTEHLIVFLVRDFKEGLRLLRTELEKLERPDHVQFHNLNPSDPMY